MAAGLLALSLLLSGCALPASGAAPGAPTTETTVAVQAAAAAPATPTPMVLALRDLWSRTRASSCLMVADGGKVLFERNPDRGVVPASTMKLLTATAVLTHLDPASRLRTPVLSTATPGPDGVLAGDLHLVGGGDPVLGTLPYGASFRRPRLVTALEVLADRLKDAGVRHVTGRVIGDDARHERVRHLPSWPARYRANHESGPLSALLVNDGFLAWGARPVASADPARGAAVTFTDVLRRRGVRVDGDPASGPSPAGAQVLAEVPSPTIAELVRQMLLDSDNETAEVLLRELGLQVRGAGTTDAGRRVVLDTLTGLGLPMAGVRIVDGSGLDPANRVTCRFLVALLATSPVRQLVDAGLPVAAQTGTLSRRFLGTPVAGWLRAKTGSLREVSSLAGHVVGSGGRLLTFAYVQNGTGRGQGTPLQDRLGHVLLATPSQ